jgi:nitrite reductase/ring-hydroxylating ferredoxin subunit
MNYYRFLLLLIFFGTFSCSKNQLNNNPYLQDISFEKVINLNLPIYLQSGGIKGLLLFNINEQIMAWEASCPNQYPSSCSKMTINGVQSICSCEDFKYSLATGQILSNSEKESYPMKLYYSEKNGNSVRISN